MKPGNLFIVRYEKVCWFGIEGYKMMGYIGKTAVNDTLLDEQHEDEN